jgi:hypothetical protein
LDAPLRYPPGHRWWGLGPPRGQTSVFQLQNGVNPTAAGGVTGVLVPTGWDANSASGAVPTEFVNIAVNGNRANNTGGQHAGIVLYNSFWSKVQDCIIYNTRQATLHLTNLAKDGTTTLASTASEFRILDNKLDSSDGDGITQVGTSAWQDVMCRANHIGNMGGRAINVRNGAGWEIANNHTYGIAQDAIYVWDGWFGTDVHDNYVEDFGGANASGATYRGIYLKGYAGRGVRCHSNQITCTEPTTNASTYNYVEIEGAAASTFTAMANVMGNQALGAGTAGTRVGFKYVNSVAGSTLRVLRSNHAFGMTTLNQDVATGTITAVTGV